VAAQKINAEPNVPVYGIVRDGTLWQFGHLVGDTFIQNRTSFTLDPLPTLFGAINFVFKAATEAAIVQSQREQNSNWQSLHLKTTPPEKYANCVSPLEN